MTGVELKVARVRLGLTQWELSLKLGVHPARLSEMETGKRAIPERVSQWLRAKLGEEAVKA